MQSLYSGLGRHGNRPAVVHDGVTLTYGELAARAERVASALQSLGVGPGTPVALAMSNRVEFVIADQAIIALGAAKVPINDMLSPSEVAYILGDASVHVAIADKGLLDSVVAAECASLSTIVGIDEEHPKAMSWCDLETAGAGRPFERPSVEPTDIGLVMYTGGTTGRQKGVVHTQSGLAINILSHLIEMELRDDERQLILTPLPHAAGFLIQAGLAKGIVNYLDVRFDVEGVVSRIVNDEVTFLFMVPTMIYRLLDFLETHPYELPSLRTILYGAAPITLDRLRQGLHLLGPVFMQLYAQTEAPDFVTRLTRRDHDLDRPHLLQSCGRPVALMSVAILDKDSVPLPAGSMGEIGVRGPYVMEGYHNLPEVSANTLRDGWLHTGDLGRMDDDGYVYILDRKNDMIISGGMNVYSVEVENAVQACPGVAQVAAVGVPHPDWGEAVVVFVVAVDGHDVSAEAVQTASRSQLAAYKRPKAVQFVDTLPTTAYGKIDKKLLRASWSGW